MIITVANFNTVTCDELVGMGNSGWSVSRFLKHFRKSYKRSKPAEYLITLDGMHGRGSNQLGRNGRTSGEEEMDDKFHADTEDEQ